MNAFDELAGYRFSPGRDYDKRSVETFRARVLNLVDDLLNQVTVLQDEVADLRTRTAVAAEEHEAPVVPTTWLDAIVGESAATPTDDAVPPSPGFSGFVRPFAAGAPTTADVPPAAFPAPPVMAWLADLEDPAPSSTDAAALPVDEPARPQWTVTSDLDLDVTGDGPTTADLLRAGVAPPPPPPAEVAPAPVDDHRDADLVDLTVVFRSHDPAPLFESDADDDSSLAPVVSLPIAPSAPPAFVAPVAEVPEPPAPIAPAPAPAPVVAAAPPPPPPTVRVVPPPPPPAAVVPPPPPPPAAVPTAPEPAPAAAVVTPEPEPEPVLAAVTPLVIPEREPEPAHAAASAERETSAVVRRLPIVLDDGQGDDDAAVLPTPVRHWSGWMRG